MSLGKHNLRRWEATQQVLRVTRQVPHPAYRPRAHDNDLMLLKLEKPARLGRAVRPIPVAQSCASPGTSCRVSGWGTTSSPGGKDGRTLGRGAGAGLGPEGGRLARPALTGSPPCPQSGTPRPCSA